MARSKSIVPASGPADVPAPLADKLAADAHAALDTVSRILEPIMDVKRLADPEWLADPENRRIASVQMKLLAIQKDMALGIISSQIKIDEGRLRETAAERQRDEGTLAALSEAFAKMRDGG